MQDYYRILEVHPDASSEVIDKAYRALVMKCHPDRFHMSDKSRLEEKMRNLNRAYETLSNPSLREEYHRRYEHHQAVQLETKAAVIWTSRFKNIGYWFLLTIFLVFTGKAIFRLFAMLPLLPKLVVIFAVAWGLRYLFLKSRKRGNG